MGMVNDKPPVAWYNNHAKSDYQGVSLAGQTAADIQLKLNRKTSGLVQDYDIIPEEKEWRKFLKQDGVMIGNTEK